MHSLTTRGNAVFSFLSTCMIALLAAIALSSYSFTTDPIGAVDITSLKVYHATARRYHNRKQELAFVNFNVSADLTSLFHWNTKQLFVYLEAEYENTQHTKNSVVIWDRIIRRKEDANVNFAGKNKYTFRELSSTFKHVPPANFSLKYNTMPYVGVLTYGEVARTSEPVEFPPAQARVSR